jgi:hypothetical protein
MKRKRKKGVDHLKESPKSSPKQIDALKEKLESQRTRPKSIIAELGDLLLILGDKKSKADIETRLKP